MKFYYELHEPELMQACYDLERRQVIEQSWRDERRQTSIALLLFVPVLAFVLAASFHYLSARQVSGYWSVVGVAVLGGLLGGVLVSLRRLVPRLRSRLAPPSFTGSLPWWLLLGPLLTGAAGGLASAFVLITQKSGVEDFRPQTVYLIALAASIVCSRLLPRSMVATTIEAER